MSLLPWALAGALCAAGGARADTTLAVAQPPPGAAAVHPAKVWPLRWRLQVDARAFCPGLWTVVDARLGSRWWASVGGRLRSDALTTAQPQLTLAFRGGRLDPASRAARPFASLRLVPLAQGLRAEATAGAYGALARGRWQVRLDGSLRARQSGGRTRVPRSPRGGLAGTWSKAAGPRRWPWAPAGAPPFVDVARGFAPAAKFRLVWADSASPDLALGGAACLRPSLAVAADLRLVLRPGGLGPPARSQGRVGALAYLRPGWWAVRGEQTGLHGSQALALGVGAQAGEVFRWGAQATWRRFVPAPHPLRADFGRRGPRPWVAQTPPARRPRGHWAWLPHSLAYSFGAASDPRQAGWGLALKVTRPQAPTGRLQPNRPQNLRLRWQVAAAGRFSAKRGLRLGCAWGGAAPLRAALSLQLRLPPTWGWLELGAGWGGGGQKGRQPAAARLAVQVTWAAAAW